MSSNDVLIVNKEYGATPLETIEALRRLGVLAQGEKVTYAGRLDPLATGALLLLRGEEVHNKERYLQLPKIYEIEITFGVATDTGDILGIPRIASHTAARRDTVKTPTLQEITQILERTKQAPYPQFSSKTVRGIPLHEYARNQKSVDRPMRAMQFQITEISEGESVTRDQLAEKVKTACELVQGDFRQAEILQAWQQETEQSQNRQMRAIRLTINAKSGTYMRAIPEILEHAFGILCVVTKIHRTQIGLFEIK